MGYKEDLQEGLLASSSLNTQSMLEALNAAISQSPERSQVLAAFDMSTGTMVVGIAESKGKAFMRTNIFASVANRGKFVPALTAPIVITVNDSGCKVAVSIKEYTTHQMTVSGFIPAGSKSVDAIDQYREFITDLARAIKSADRDAEVTFTGRR